MLNLEKLLDVVKQILHFMKYGNKLSMYVDSSSSNGDAVFIPASVHSFYIVNLGANGAGSTFQPYTITDGDSYTETVTANELSISRDAGPNGYFLKSYNHDEISISRSLIEFQ